MITQDNELDPPATLSRIFLVKLRRHFSLRPGTDYEETPQFVRSQAEFHGGNTWALIFAILICSVGLNVNSTAVIIGAMLISPLMGPIVGTGFGMATNDFDLLRRGLRNLFLAAAVALLASTLYFLVSPLSAEQSELLARTRPTLYDVLIALFGGGAGAVALTRKNNKDNVVPGVAIATALMPPLCTAGFAIAQGKLPFLLGALHLFLINALFIFLSSLGFFRLMKFHRAAIDPGHLLRNRVILALITLGIALPSAYTAWTVVNEARFQQLAHRFISDNLKFPDRAVVNVELRYARPGSTISATLLGKPLPEDTARVLQQRLAAYGLAGTQLELNQPIEAQASVEQLSTLVRQRALEDLYRHNEKLIGDRDARIRVLEEELIKMRTHEFPVAEIYSELSALFPTLVSLGIGREFSATAIAATSPGVIVTASWQKLPSASDQDRLRAFLTRRLDAGTLRLVNVTE